MKPALAALSLIAVVLVGCAAATAPSSPGTPFDDVDLGQLRELPPPGRFQPVAPAEVGAITITPTSAPLEHGVAYRFSLGHCGLQSPIDLDGSFWDAVDGIGPTGAPLDLASDGEMINATSGIVVVIGDEARFRTESGSVIRLARHAGDTEVPPCM